MSSHPAASKENMPPKRERKAMRSVSAPGSSISFNRFIYLLVALSTLFIAFYAYRLTTWKNDVGGWWNLATGHKNPPIDTSRRPKSSSHHPKDESVQDRIEALAKALGMPSKDLASAIASAVKEYVPPATISSVAAHETGEAAKILADGDQTASAEATGVVGSMMEGFVGMDEPM